MSKGLPVTKQTASLLPLDIAGFESLAELALDMRWSWNHAADEVWQQIDPQLWELTHNPWVVVQTVSREKCSQLLANPDFRGQVDQLLQAKHDSATAPAWFQRSHATAPLSCVAYFSMEFMLSEALPIYSGGLGNVAGDQLKAASDLGVPVVGVGLLYQQGYFRQVLDQDGAQQALYPYNDPWQLPVTPVREPSGEWLRLELQLPGHSVWLRAWQVQIGRVKLYLLDSNDPANIPVRRGITSELYGGGPELRLNQELVLGIGGWRLLDALGLKPEVCHLNEGHAAFAVLERARSFMVQGQQPFAAALAATRAGNLFTTHTPVAAGFDRFAPELMERYLGWYAEHELGLPLHEMLSLGRRDPQDAAEPFNMAYLAVRGSGAVNAVSRLHGAVSRRILGPLFPRWPQPEVPIGYVTNGVHVPTWESAASESLWSQHCGPDRWLGTADTLEQDIRGVSDEKIWQYRTAATQALIDYARARLAQQLAASGATSEELGLAQQLFDPHALTLGFARRFASYKRPNLLLHDPPRLLRLLSNPERPVQLIIAGKAHPADQEGQGLIRQWTQFIRRPEVRPHVIFLSDYDMLLTERLVQGVDVWINTPRRPWEACGTSGMKVLVNGGLNLSELDGWWAEAYTPEVGWALGDGQEHGDDPAWDAAEAEALYDLLEQQVIPEFYSRNASGIPAGWVRRMRESMAQLTARFSANRAVREYTEEYYLPAAVAYARRAADNGAGGKLLADWRRELDAHWPALHFGEVRIETRGEQHYFEVQVLLNALDPQAVQVELYADSAPDGAGERHELQLLQQPDTATGACLYGAAVSAARPAADYTPRIIPRYPGVNIALEATHILWLR